MRFILIKESILIPMLSFLLVLGFLVLDKNILSTLTKWDTISQEVPSHKWEVFRKVYGYAATNMFNRGYTKETDFELYHRLSIYPEGESLKKGSYAVPDNAKEGLLKLVLPEGFKNGILRLRAASELGYKIGISYDLHNWEFYDYPGYKVQTFYSVDLEKKDLTGREVFLKFLPLRNEGLDVHFDIFQYVSNQVYDEKGYNDLLFSPDMDIDYEGKKIIQPGIVIYGKDYFKTDPQR